jgi:hypothetical protein
MAKKALTEAQRARRKAVAEKAKAAATAAGKDWKSLPREERKSLRRQVRKEAT